ncbi:hypothetical protein GN958_ATG22182, partial [Phytophthora infestans]
MANAEVPVVSCAFLRVGCDCEETLFAPTYISYCGCSLNISITFGSEEAAAAADRKRDLLICARFESTTTSAIAGAGDVATAMLPGATVALPVSVLTPSERNAMESDWIKAEKASFELQAHVPKNAILYELNNCISPMWYYSYESGSTKAQRRMKHVLAAYVCILHTGDDGVVSTGVRLSTVILRLESPPFTMVSYRRQSTKSRSGQVHTPPLRGERLLPVHPPEFGSLLPPLAHVFQRNFVGSENDESIPAVTVRETASRQLQDRPKPAITDPVHRPQHLCCPVCHGKLTLGSSVHRLETVDLLQPLLLLQVFMKSVPINAFTQYDSTSVAEQNVAREPKVAIQSWNARSCTKPAETRFVQLSMGRFVIGGAPQKVDSVSNPTRKQVVLRSCANLLVSAFSSERFQALTATHLSAGVAEWHDDGEHTARVSCEKMYQFVAAIFDDLEQMLVSQGEDRYPSLVALVDDVLSLIYSEPTHSALRSTASTILLYKEDSIKAMVQDLYRVFKEHCQDAGD